MLTGTFDGKKTLSRVIVGIFYEPPLGDIL
jgi:hypothetical protein